LEILVQASLLDSAESVLKPVTCSCKEGNLTFRSAKKQTVNVMDP